MTEKIVPGVKFIFKNKIHSDRFITSYILKTCFVMSLYTHLISPFSSDVGLFYVHKNILLARTIFYLFIIFSLLLVVLSIQKEKFCLVTRKSFFFPPNYIPTFFNVFRSDDHKIIKITC